MGKNLKKLTILHSNDLHGDFLAKEIDDSLLGGVSMLSGYVSKVRREEENVIYAIAGDMFRGSLIDSEYKGISTIEIMNMISPDVVTLGNHEVDYGIAHLLFIEKCAMFPIINANLYLTTNNVRLFQSHIILEIDGMNVLFIGVLTEEVMAQARLEKLIGSIVNVEEAAREVGRICDSYKNVDIDFTVLLTHIGIEADKELAAKLDPRWGVDIIIGGHSHTLLEEPVVVAGIPIVQAASGTAQIGRFDIMVDTDLNSIDSYAWQLVPINPENCPRDTQLEEIILKYKNETDEKYDRLLTRLADRYTHPQRNTETMLGKLFADAYKDALGVDIVLLGSGSIRGEEMGPIVRHYDLIQIFPYNDATWVLYVNGEQLKRMIKHILREEAFYGHTEFYQFSRGLRIEYDRKNKDLISLSYNGMEVMDSDEFKIALQDFHYQSMDEFLAVTHEEVQLPRAPKVISTNNTDMLEEFFRNREMIRVSEEKRLIIHE
ncbi:MAG TPA: bifunctional UDP-sugar hydrolase/5'-nucleotidase [Clostridiales bacterium]|nr:bifunctional UDP-sugar hydrolase/5'-nucleotidase [Clostridiales bacterium]